MKYVVTVNFPIATLVSVWYMTDFGSITPNPQMARRFCKEEEARLYIQKYGKRDECEIIEVEA